MARFFKKLSVLDVRKHIKEGVPRLISDGDGLYLRVEGAGTASWTFIFHHRSKRREMGLGRAGEMGVSLLDARDKAGNARKLLRDGRDPIEARKAAANAAIASSMTFGKFADEYVENHRAGWKSEKHANQWAMTLGDAYCKEIRRKPIGEINVEDVLAILKPIWSVKPETASRIRMRIEKVLAAAKVKKLRIGENPAQWRGNLEHLLGNKSRKDKEHHAAMPFKDLPLFMALLREMDSVSARALEFAILTATRTNEVIAATWDEIDFNNKTWTIPAKRMKAGKEHRVPLSGPAIKILRAMQGKSEKWIFPGLLYDKPLSNMAMLMLLKGMGRNETVHGFRSTFRDWVAERTGYPSEVAEKALAHAIKSGTEAAYRRGDLFDKRMPLMDDWADYVLSASVENVLSLRADTVPR